MARSVTFGGQTAFKPGALSKIVANAGTNVGLSATGIVALIGEAEGGEPGVIQTIDDPAGAKDLYRSGALADAIRIAFDSSNDARISGGAFRVLAYKTNNSTQASTHLPGDEALISDTENSGTSTTTVIEFTTGGLTVDAHIGRYLEVVSGERRRIVDNDATSCTVSPGFSAAPASGSALKILETQMIVTSRDYGVHTNQVSVEFEQGVTTDTSVITLAFEDEVEQSPELGGTSYLDIKYVGGPQEDTGTVGTVTATTFELDVASAPTLNAWAGMFVRFSNGLQRLISGNTAADPSVVTLDSAHALSTAEQAEVDATTAEIIDVTSATVSITGANGVATGLSSAVLPTADDLSLTWSTLGISTLRELVDYLNANTNYEAVVPAGVNSDTTLLSSYDYGTRNTTVDVRFDDQIDYVNKGTFRRDLQVSVDWINDFSELATAVKATGGTGEGSELPLYTGGVTSSTRDVAIYLTGGTRGISTNTNFQSGFDAMIEERANHCIPLISEDLTNEGNGSTATIASVAAQLSAYIDDANSSAKNEQGGYLGFKGTRTEVLAQAASLNNDNIHLFPQQFTVLDVDGTLVQQPEWSSAVAAAGMRSGADIGEPLTYKFIKTFAVDQDSSWSPKNLTDINKLIEGGVMFAEQVTGGFRWVRDLTTHLQDDNVVFTGGSTRDAVRYVAYDLRTFLEDRFTGTKATPATVTAIKTSAAAKLSTYVTEEILVESLDPETQSQTLPGYRNLRVTISGNVASLFVEIFPVTSVDFQLITINVSLPTLAA